MEAKKNLHDIPDAKKLLHDIRNITLGYHLDHEAIIPFASRDTLVLLTTSYVTAIGALQHIDGQLWTPVDSLIRNIDTAIRKQKADFTLKQSENLQLPMLRGSQSYRFLLFINLALAEIADADEGITMDLAMEDNNLKVSIRGSSGDSKTVQPAEWFQTLFFHSSPAMPYLYDPSTGAYDVTVSPTHLLSRTNSTES